MISQPHPSLLNNSQRLTALRWALLGLLGLALLISQRQHIALPYGPLLGVIICAAGFNLLCQFQQRYQPSHPQQLLFDILLISIALYYAGGATSPFAPIYLIPLSIASALLRWQQSLVFLCLCMGAYTLLLFHYLPFPTLDSGMHNHMGRSHTIGMWINFLLSAVLITGFISWLSSNLRKQQAALSANRERQLRDEQLLAVATQAAAAAHKMGTPLNTMTLLLDELLLQSKEQTETFNADLKLMQQQVQQCKNCLQQLSQQAELTRLDQAKAVAADQWLQQTLEQWQMIRPQARYSLSIADQTPIPHIHTDLSLQFSVINLLNNAADASNSDVECRLHWDLQQLRLTISDSGKGLPHDLTPGMQVYTSKAEGMGIGLMISHATIERLGGVLSAKPNTPSGTIMTLCLPLAPCHD